MLAEQEQYFLVDGEWHCLHANLSIEKPDSIIAGSAGYIESADGGLDSISCPNPFCDGLTTVEKENLLHDNGLCDEREE